MTRQPGGIDRRLFLVSGLFAAAMTLPGTRAAWAADSATASALSAPQMRFLAAFCDTVLPATDTPGALVAEVPAFIARIALRASDAAQIEALRGSIDGLERMLDGMAGQSFAAAPAAQRHAVLTQVDAAAMEGHRDCRVPSSGPAEGQPDHATYRLLKAVTVWGFYTSEAGGSQDLRFELVPGSYEPDIELAPDWRNYCNETVLGQ